LLSSWARSLDVAQAAAFALWLTLVVFIDLILLGATLRDAAPAQLAIGISLANPLQAFRTAAMMLFDPQLVLLGPAAFAILDAFSVKLYPAWAIIKPAVTGATAALVGFWRFRSGDLA